jgi:hypothetical protein
VVDTADTDMSLTVPVATAKKGAQAAKRGLWADANPVLPCEFRRKGRYAR